MKLDGHMNTGCAQYKCNPFASVYHISEVNGVVTSSVHVCGVEV